MQEYYFDCFWHLCSERRFEGGRIPWSSTCEYGRHVGLDDDIINEIFVPVMRALDEAFLEWSAQETEKRRKEIAAGGATDKPVPRQERRR